MSQNVARTSLHEIAPRLAVARDLERWNIWCAGDEAGISDGDYWAEFVGDPRHWMTRCRGCGGVVDNYEFDQRFLHGCNRGWVRRMLTAKCRNRNTGRCEWWSRG